jgi:hypothetical protein
MVSKSPVTFWLTRIVFLRCLGLVYFTAFLVAFTQVGETPLLFEKGVNVGSHVFEVRRTRSCLAMTGYCPLVRT